MRNTTKQNQPLQINARFVLEKHWYFGCIKWIDHWKWNFLWNCIKKNLIEMVEKEKFGDWNTELKFSSKFGDWLNSWNWFQSLFSLFPSLLGRAMSLLFKLNCCDLFASNFFIMQLDLYNASSSNVFAQLPNFLLFHRLRGTRCQIVLAIKQSSLDALPKINFQIPL